MSAEVQYLYTLLLKDSWKVVENKRSGNRCVISLKDWRNCGATINRCILVLDVGQDNRHWTNSVYFFTA